MRMIIANKDHNDAYNLRHVTNLYIGSDGRSVKCSAGSTTRGGILGKYGSYDETRKALDILLDRIDKGGNVIYMPDDSEVTDGMKSKQAYHHITGKKTKGHGGS